MSWAALLALVGRTPVQRLPAVVGDRPWGLVLGLLVVAALLVVAGMVALSVARRRR